jgi:hypothetical protein
LWLGERSTVGGVRERRDGRGKNRVWSLTSETQVPGW